MILISVLGLDQYVVGHYSKDHTKNIADLLETSPDEVSFYAPYAFMFHDGVEQTSWDVAVRVFLPIKYHHLEANVSKYILKTMSDFAINVTVIFEYYDNEHEHSHVNDKYQRFLTEDNFKKNDYKDDEYVEGEDEESTSDDEEMLPEEDMFKDIDNKED